MITQNPIYQRLVSAAITEAQGIYPVRPTVDTQLPFVVVTTTSATPITTLTGPTTLTALTIEVSVHAIDVDSMQRLLAATKASLHTAADTAVMGCFLQAESYQEEEYGYHATQTYSAWIRGV